MKKRLFQRHNNWDIFIHWFNAACWLILLVTGIALIDNPAINPLGDWYPKAIRAAVGGGGNLLLIHEIVGIAWALGFLVYLFSNWAGAKFFLKEVFRISPARDTKWMVKKQIQMTMGNKGLKLLGFDTRIPPQGFYNMGQKVFAQAAVVGSVLIAVSGAIMVFSQTNMTAEQTIVVSWAILVHYVAVGVVLAGLLLHIYMAAISPEERPAFFSMFSGSVPEDYARHHHELWYEEVKDVEPDADGVVRQELEDEAA